MLDFFSDKLKPFFIGIDLSKISEIRLRKDFPIVIKKDNDYLYLTEKDVSKSPKNAVICDKKDLTDIINALCENSIYAFNERIKEGYLTTNNGVRIGIAGQCVFEKGKIITVKDFTSLNIRIPHDVLGSSNEIYKKIFKKTMHNTLIVSPPGQGKTTIIKDLALKISDKMINVLLIDERGEMKNVRSNFIDKIEFSNKEYAFNYAIRSMSPSVIIVDELSNENDFNFALTAVNSGVKLIATAHSDDIIKIRKKPYFVDGVFDRYVLLKSVGKPGQIDKIYNGEYEKL